MDDNSLILNDHSLKRLEQNINNELAKVSRGKTKQTKPQSFKMTCLNYIPNYEKINTKS